MNTEGSVDDPSTEPKEKNNKIADSMQVPALIEPHLHPASPMM